MIRFIAIACLLLVSGCVSSPEPSSVFDDASFDDISSVVQDNLAVAQTSQTSLYTYAGVWLFVLGSTVMAFFNRSAGIQLMLAGVVAGSVPFVVASQYFNWIAGVTLLTVAGIGIWHLWFRVKLSETEAQEQADKNN
jgi:hypothetical protein